MTPQPRSTQPHRPYLFLRKFDKLAIFMIVMLSISLASAQSLQFRFSFEDSGTNVLSGPDGALGSSLSLSSLNFSGAATDIHGAAGSGVQQKGQALDFSSGVNTGTSANPTINGPIAYALNNPVLGSLGSVSSFTATMWFKQLTSMTNTLSRGPRLLLLGGTNVVDNNATTNDISLYLQTTNAIYFKLNNSTISAPIYYNPLPTNVWLFIALVYDGNNAMIYMGSEATPAKLLTIQTVGAQVVDFTTGGTSGGNLVIGNRTADRGRSFSGWFDDVRFYTGAGDATFIENIRQAATPLLVSSIYPDGLSLLEGTNTLSFTASSTNGIDAGGIKVAVNGTDVTAGLAIGGTSTTRTVTYTNLPVNPALTSVAGINAAVISISITDHSGIVTTNSITYDAFSPTNFTWEAEDYDFNAGVYIDNPIFAFAPAENSYFGQSGVPPIDYSDNGAGTPRVYRSAFDLVETEVSVGTGVNGGVNLGELMRQKIRDAFALDNTVRDVDMGNFDGPGAASGLPNWVNYTRTFPSGQFNIYTRVAFGATAGSSTLSQITSGWGTGTQTSNQLGSFTLANTGGWQSYAWIPLRDSAGNLVHVGLNGTNTFNLTANAGGGGNNNFFMLIPANTNVPSILGVYPNGTNLFQSAASLTFTAISPAGITIGTNSISVRLSVTNLASGFTTNLTAANGLVITGNATNRAVSYPLQANAAYTAVITVTDANGNPATSTVSFDTYSPSFLWEAEDFNHDSGQIVTEPQTNGYLGLPGTTLVDAYVVNIAEGTVLYRPTGANTEVNGDKPRSAYINTGFTDYDMGWNDSGNWANYTRTLPAGVYNVLMRGADGGTGGGTAGLALVTGDITSSNQTTTNLGTFTIPPTGGWQSYTYIPLRDAGGNLAKITGGSTVTLRVNSGGGYNANFYALVPANTNLPTLLNVTPDGTAMFQATTTLSFTANSSAGIATNNIQVLLNEVDISTNLTITGTSTSRSVTYPHLQLNNTYSLQIVVTDGNGNSASTSETFDTFSSTNYTWEAEDFDYNGGHFIPNPQTNLYATLAAVAEVDTHQVNFAGVYLYRTNGMDTEVNGDKLRAAYQGTGQSDYTMGYFSSDAWANYTRDYPNGSYNIYLRAATGGATDSAATLSLVTGGWGTSNQTTTTLGTFTLPLTGWESYSFAPLRDDGGNLVTVSITGPTNTFRLVRPPVIQGLPDVNANFLMLAPAAVSPSFKISAALQSQAIVISFPTAQGSKYQVQYKTNFADASWIPLGSPITGDGNPKSASDPATGIHRFYRVQVQ